MVLRPPWLACSRPLVGGGYEAILGAGNIKSQGDTLRDETDKRCWLPVETSGRQGQRLSLSCRNSFQVIVQKPDKFRSSLACHPQCTQPKDGIRLMSITDDCPKEVPNQWPSRWLRSLVYRLAQGLFPSQTNTTKPLFRPPSRWWIWSQT